MNKSTKNTLWFNQLSLKDVPLVGGKNASLGEMYSELSPKGINIPNGFALTSKAFWRFLSYNKIDRKLKEIFSKFNPKDLKSLQVTGKEARSLILKADFPEDLKKEVLLSYKKLSKQYGQENTDVAVRSSATAEDLPSIAGDEMVFVRLGNKIKYIEMEKLFEQAHKNENNELIFVPSLESNRKIKWRRVKEIYKHPAKNKVLYKIITKSGREITITSDHSLIGLDPDTFNTKVVSINKTNGSTRVPVIKHLPLVKNGMRAIDVRGAIRSKPTIVHNKRIKIKQLNTLNEQYGLPQKLLINKDFAYFLGIYLAEGSIYEKRNCIDISCDSPLVLERVRKFYRSIGSYQEKKIEYGRKVRIQNAALAAFLCDVSGKPLAFKGKGRSARVKYVPEFIFVQPEETIGEFLKGFFDGDGWIDETGMHCCSLSKKLIGGIVKLLEMLEIKCYIGKKCSTVTIPESEARRFKELINFSENRNQNKLEKLIQEYRGREKHQDFIETFPPSKKISELLEKELKPKLKLERVKVLICPQCGGEMVKGGTYKDYQNKNIKIQRYFCKKCHWYPSQKVLLPFKEKTVLKYIYYDQYGRFKKGLAPWNRGNRKKLITYGISHLRRIAKTIKSKQLLNITNSDIIWDKIKKIEPIRYSGFVYDFVVPGTQNFAAGLGGIITHNSASFAGQHETYLNIRGPEDLLKAIKKCLASLFTNRAISYREEKGFDHLKIALSVGVMKMVRSDLASAGVIFTLDTESGFKNVVMINSIYGVGEMIVKGKITPDQFYVFKPTLSQGYKSIIVKNLGRKTRKYIYAKGGGIKEIKVLPKDQIKFSLSDEEVIKLAKWACLIEDHYSKKVKKWMPQDIEWAKDGKTGQLFVVQSRPETVHAIQVGKFYEEYQVDVDNKPILKGLAIGDKIGQGRVRVIPDVSKIGEFKKGEILVTRMTDPDWVAIFPLASAIITEEGGRTCHAAIVSRELGIPCVVGAENATKILRTGQLVTVDCASGSEGRIFLGKIHYKIKRYDLAKIPRLKTKVMVNIGAPEIAFKTSFLPVQGVGLAREEFIIAEKIRIHPLALFHFNQLKGKKVKKEIAEITAGYKNKKEYFVEKLAEGIAQIGAAFYPREVVVRFSDFKTNEYAALIGGEQFEPKEANPMLGWRGASRYYDEKFKPAFEMECRAIKRAREVFGLKNIVPMVPFCRTVKEGKRVVSLIEKARLKRGRDGLKIYVMCEIPSNVILAEEFLKIFDGMSIGSNDLTQLSLGMDRDNPRMAQIGNENDQTIKRMISRVIKLCRQKKKYSGICGQAPSDYPEFAKFLLKEGIGSMSLNPDTVIKTILSLAKIKKVKVEKG